MLSQGAARCDQEATVTLETNSRFVPNPAHKTSSKAWAPKVKSSLPN